ncbi:hypothetical protein Arth_0516 [Arthrobacter sp. FB24]|uniref:hypothetical protein n=1 Tax=Arthrobacter sp. (strain FB24) TaxID=290399 RepID=UPI000052747E|nr:hypothetical protein [Arthrobacter sp. FB24]ABK01915.1 hypothetical protein Arth_0516 [Arthrobacter sp. FB24]
MRRQIPAAGHQQASREPQDARKHLKGPTMSNNYSAPPPGENRAGDTESYPEVPRPPQGRQAPPYPPQQFQQHPYAAQPHTAQPQRNNKNLIIVLAAVAAAVIVALVAVFVWVIPAFSKPQAEGNPAPAATSSEAASSEAAGESPAPEESAAPSADPGSDGMPAGAFPLPAGWAELQGPAKIPADDDPLYNRFVTGESSFSYLSAWSSDDTFGITKDPSTGAPMQQVAKGTEERDGDGISTAFAFFAEAEEGKYGKEPAKVQAAIKDIEAKLKAIPAAELPQHLVGHKCAGGFEASTPEIREFRRAAAVVVGFTCTNAGGDAIRAVNLFTVTPWGTPQMVGVSGHESYWSANPEALEKIGNSYRANRWKLDG